LTILAEMILVVRAWVTPDALWQRIEPLLPVRPAGRRGPKPLPDRLVLQGILFVLHTGIGWEDLPQELSFGSGMTCWRRLRDWHAAGIFDQLHHLLLAELNAAARIDWSRACADSSSVRAKKGEATGPSPVDRAKTGSKHHLICDGAGTPLAVTVTGAHRNDTTQLIPLIDAIPPVRGRPGRPRRRPEVLLADRDYDHDVYRDQVRARGMTPLISRRKTRDDNTAGRWVVEQTLACSTSSAASPPDGNAVSTSTKASSPWPTPSSAGADSTATTQSVRSS
jgi:transposase